MPDLLREFFAQAEKNLARLDAVLPGLEKSPTDADVWEGLKEFFKNMRAVSPFIGFSRLYALADTALSDIDAYQKGQKGLEVLPPVLMKFQRAKKILHSAEKIEREPSGSDADILPQKNIQKNIYDVSKEADIPSALLQSAKLLSAKEKKIIELEKKLDEREEALVVWAKTLSEEQIQLRQFENRINEEEQKVSMTESGLQEAVEHLNRKEAEIERSRQDLLSQKESLLEEKKELAEQTEKLLLLKEELQQLETDKKDKERELKEKEEHLFSIEDQLNQLQLDIEADKKRLKEKEDEQGVRAKALEEREKFVQINEEELKQLEKGLHTKAEIKSHLETELRLQIQGQKKQLVLLEESLQRTQDQYAQAEAHINSLYDQQEEKNKAYAELVSALTDESKRAGNLKTEIEDLRLLHNELHEKAAALDQEVSFHKLQTKQAENALVKQTEMYESLQDELKASAWPLDVECLQKNITDLIKAKLNYEKPAGNFISISEFSAAQEIWNAAQNLKDFLLDIRSRSFRSMFSSIHEFVLELSEKFQRPCVFDPKYPDGLTLDVEAEKALSDILIHLIRNSMEYAVMQNAEDDLFLSLSVSLEGTMLSLNYSDNGTRFDFDTLRRSVIQSGLLNKDNAGKISTDDLIQYLFHPHVTFKKKEKRGLAHVAQVLEKLGGQVSVSAGSHGMHVSFSIPRNHLLGQAFIFSTGQNKYALPLSMVRETFSLKQQAYPITEKDGTRLLSWKGWQVPFVELPKEMQQDENEYGIIIQAGPFTFLLPVPHILNTEQVISVSDQGGLLIPCVTLESGEEFPMLDLSVLLSTHALKLSGNTATVKIDEETSSLSVSYLIFKSAPEIFGAVCVDCVERIDSYAGGEKVLLNEKELPLKDMSQEKDYPYARAVLILKNEAYAIQEVVDITDSVLLDDKRQTLSYNGNDIPIIQSVD